MAPTLQDFEYQFKDDGMILNNDSITPFHDVHSISGLAQPEYRVTIKNREGFDGGYVESRYKNPRSIVVEFSTYLDSVLQDSSLDELRYNFRPVDVYEPFYFKHPGINQRLCFCKVVGFNYTITRDRGITKVNCVLSLIAADPTFYDSQSFTAQFGPFIAPSTGLIFDVTFDANFGGNLGAPGFQSITNYGNSISYPVFMIPGGTVNPKIENQTTGLIMQFVATVPTNNTLIIDNRARSARLDNGANYRVHMTSQSSWLYFVPGVNALFYSADSGSGLLTVTHRNAWE